MSSICKICNESIKNDRHFYQKHKISAAEYYVKYYPRRDLLTNDPIIFKNKIKYFSTFFNNKGHMKKWVLKSDRETFLKFLSILVAHRNKTKQLKKPLGELELTSLDNFPSLSLILKKISISDYKKVFSDLKVTKGSFSDYSLKPAKIKHLEIGVDTREQYPFKLENSRPFKMDYGDYTALGEDFDNVFIDRKSDKDFISTFGGDVGRFRKEIERAESFGAYLVVLVETDINKVKSGKGRLFYYTKCSPEMVLHNVRELAQDYDNVQFLFAKSRVEARRCVTTILSYGSKVREVDLQYLYNGGKL